MGFSFRVKALRFIFREFCIRFVDTCSLHVPFIFPCPPTQYPTTIRPLSIKIMENHQPYVWFSIDRAPGMFFAFFSKEHRKSSNICFKIKTCRRLDLFATPGIGMGVILYLIYIYIYIYILFCLYILFIFCIYVSTLARFVFDPIWKQMWLWTQIRFPWDNPY